MSPTPTSSTRRGYLIALAATVAWSSSGIIVAYLTGAYGIPPLAIAVWRNLIVTIFLFALFAIRARHLLQLERCHLPLLGVYGVALGLLNGLYPVSVALNGAAVATVLIFSAPLFSGIAGMAFFGEPLSVAKAIAIAIGMAGCVLVSGAYDATTWQVNGWGIAAGLGTGLSFAACGLVGRRLTGRGLAPWSLTAYGFLFSTMLMVLLLGRHAMTGLASSRLVVQGGQWERAAGWVALVVLALGPTLGGHGLYNASLEHLPALNATLVTTLEPPITAALAYWLLGESLGPAQLVGGGLVILGVAVVVVSDRYRSRRMQGELARSS